MLPQKPQGVTTMRSIHTDLSIFLRLNLKTSPLAIKFQFFLPEGIDPLPADRCLSLCEMMIEAQKTGKPFYFSREQTETCVGKILLGMQEMEPFAESGQIGEKLRVFQEARANYALYQYVPRFEKNVVRYLVFSLLEQLAFEPDLLILAADATQAEIIMRSMTYSTGELYNSTTTPVMGCAWIFIYPFKSGKVNFLVPEMIHGMKARELFSKDTILISIPYRWIPIMAQNLREMTWHLPAHRSRELYLSEFKAIIKELAEKS